jgi:hypothetical protein
MSEGANALLSEETTAGNYFISNYPPYSFWNPEQVSQAHAALDRPPRPDAALGIYVHIPFCRKRCHFCYFKVYTGKDSDEIDRYLDAVIRELTLYSEKRFIGGRKPSFIYFGGGTPSFLSTRQLSRIVDAMKRQLAWDQAEEIAFECEPGTITEGKLEILREMGVTRLSLGIENFDDYVLETNGRADGSKEIAASYQFARAIGFPQINLWLDCGQPRSVGESPNCVYCCFVSPGVCGNFPNTAGRWGKTVLLLERRFAPSALAEDSSSAVAVTSTQIGAASEVPAMLIVKLERTLSWPPQFDTPGGGGGTWKLIWYMPANPGVNHACDGPES